MNEEYLKPVDSDATHIITSHIDIDDRLIAIATIEKQIADYEALREHRVSAIDKELAWLEQSRKEHRAAIQQYMADNGEKTLNYPGVGKVSRKQGKAKWVVKDEATLLDFLVKNVPSDILEKVIKATPKIVKKELDPVLDKFAAANKLPPDAVSFDVPEDVLSITLDKGNDLQLQIKDMKESLIAETPAEREKPAPPQRTISNYDELEI